MFLSLQFEWAPQRFELISDKHAIQRDVLRQVMMSYTAILIGMQNFGISTSSFILVGR
jgi:hypothetical protein